MAKFSETEYRRDVECRGCGRTFAAPVRLAQDPKESDHSDGVEYSVPSFCPECATDGGKRFIYRRIDPSEGVSLTWTGRFKRLIGLLADPEERTVEIGRDAGSEEDEGQ